MSTGRLRIFVAEVVALPLGRYAILHPCRFRSALQVMVEKLLEPDRKILGIAPLGQVMRLVVVLEQPGRLAESAQRHEEFDALVPRNRPIIVIVHDQDGGPDIRCEEDRRILDVEIKTALIPKRLADAALTIFILGDAAVAGLPADAAIGACHVAYRSTGARRGEHVGTGHKVGSLIASPALTLDGHTAPVDERELPAHCLGPGADAVVGTLARMARSTSGTKTT